MRREMSIALAMSVSMYGWAAPPPASEVGWNAAGGTQRMVAALPDAQAVDVSNDYTLPSLDAPDAEASLVTRTTVTLSEIRITGSTVFTEAELAEWVRPYVNRPVSTEDLQQLRLDLSRRYLERGYVNSGVVIPDQRVENGAVELNAIEGELSRIEIVGDPKLYDGYILGRLDRHIHEPLNVKEVQNALQYLQRDPHITKVNARLVPGAARGESVLRVEVDEPDRFDVMLGVDNHRTSSVGAERGRVAIGTRNLTGLGETFRGSTAISDGSDDYSAALEVPLTRWNTTIQGYFSRSDSTIVERKFEDLDIESVTDTTGSTVSQPVYDSLNNTISTVAGFEAKSSKTELLGKGFSFSPGANDGEAETRVALFGLDWVNRGDNHVAALRGTWRRGLDIDGATIFDPKTELEALLNPTGADGEFDMFVAQGMYLHRLNQLPLFGAANDRGQLVLRAAGQFSQDPLMALEKLAIGGVLTVRGYPENLLVRDSGFSASAELQIPVPGYVAEPHWRNLMIAPFVDMGGSWDESDTDRLSSTRNTDEARHLASAGLGLLWQPLRGLNAQLYWGADIYDNFDGDDPRDDRSDTDLQDDGVHFALTYSASF
jgi:hemolysin activation/secretion protein